MRISSINKRYISLASVICMLVVWKILSLHLRSDFVLPSPEKTLVTTLTLFGNTGFLATVGTTILRGLTGFIISGILGIATGIITGINPNINAFLQPILVTIRSIPVISIILLALIWFHPGAVPVFIGMLTMFPFITTNVSDGIRSIDSELVVMATFYKISRKRIIRELYIPAIMPFIVSGASSALGIGWRAIIIGEVLSQPEYGIGTMMQNAQTFLNVDAVIAWTIIAVLISFIFEKTIRWIESKFITWRS
ncbi:MAG TPA: ABC transporter permease [Bacteroidales bacterium]|jgi:NitT/TauT family transport system permease protein|nr:ABC transporter permease subunit [Bacteroidales bacterium]OQB61023.1 MAG: Bicarbonate transport system permease protein CmpB [Bacteroidetes bacterium ADurb.Bin145]HOU03083.1 ABC transporter permease [Bacteroidales bacterium]HQG63818.1 ABC transporter permease [Bacteroidales bacterium]HQK68506.1 ABC transporter permease [Bacteroidales bacterium]